LLLLSSDLEAACSQQHHAPYPRPQRGDGYGPPKPHALQEASATCVLRGRREVPGTSLRREVPGTSLSAPLSRFEVNAHPGWAVLFKTMRKAFVAVAILGLASPAVALPPEAGARVVGAARELLGVKYRLGGRLRTEGEGIDCQGLIFYGLQVINRCGYLSYSLNPTESVAWRELGAPVPGLAPASALSFDKSLLQPGDVVFLLAPSRNPREPALTTLGGAPQWVWHTGLATNGGAWIHADYTTGYAREEDLRGFLVKNGYAGVFVLRMDRGPTPRRCRHHAPMRPPSAAGDDGDQSESGRKATGKRESRDP
jgi:cell wall-associated NlpC family hydrolase